MCQIYDCKAHDADNEHPLCFAAIQDERWLAEVKKVESKRLSEQCDSFRYCFFCANDPDVPTWMERDRLVREQVRHLRE